ncbi:MAG: signal peptide peptidase SppA [Planctomycetota bacterium]
MGWLLRRLTRLLRFGLLSWLWALRALLGALIRSDLLEITLRGEVPDFPRGSTVQRLLSKRPPHLSLHEAVAALDEAARPGTSLRGVLLVLDQAHLAWIQAEALCAAIGRAQEAGLKVLVWGDGLLGPGLAVAAKADQALGASQGTLGFLGIRVRNMFVHDLFSQLGVVPLLHRHGDYKTFADTFMRQSMSEAHREMSEELARDLYAQVMAPVAEGRGLTLDAARAALDDAPVAHATAIEKGLLDGEAFRDELRERAAALCGVEDPKQARVVPAAPLLVRRARRRWLGSVLRDHARVRVLELRGGIVDGEHGRGCPAALFCEALDEAREDEDLAAVVLRIDSPGGSVTASERIWRAVKRLDEKKPVVASLGRVAASGGYYAAVGARTIVAHAGTLTGSIGVVSGKFHVAPALRRLGVSFDAVQVGARAGMMDPDRGLDPGEDEALFRELMRYYDGFLERVAAGRNMTKEQVDPLARGRVYTGRIAHGHGLVDRLGGLRVAVAVAMEAAELTEERTVVEHVHPKDERLGLSTLAGGQELSPALASLEEGLALLRAPALAYCPLEVLGI